MKFFLMLSALLSLSAFAAEVTKNGEVTYQAYTLKAKGVKGVKVTFKKNYKRTDCNRLGIEANAVFLEGNRDEVTKEPINWSTRYFISAGSVSGIIGCPRIDPVNDTARSEALDFPSYTNQFLNGEVDVNLLVPKGYELEVVEY